MPPRITVPNGNAPDLIPNPNTNDDENTFAGLPVVPAKEQTKDAFNVLFYAYPGVGKTTIAGMFAGYPPACPVLIVDAEGGAHVLANLDNVYVVQVRTWADVERLLRALQTMPIDNQRYRTVVFDNLTEMHAMLVTSIAGTAPVEIQQHGAITAALMAFTRKVRDLSRFRGINTALIAWQDNKEIKGQGIVRQVVALTDKLSARIPGIPNNVGFLTTLNNPPLYTRRLSFQASPMNDAKLRRAPGDNTLEIPLEIYYGLDQNPIVDILKTLYEGVPFPTDNYARPTRKTPANVGTNSTDTTTTD